MTNFKTVSVSSFPRIEVVFCHLYNDWSGSPKVLMSTIELVNKIGGKSMLYIGSAGRGCLSSCHLPIKQYWYRRSNYRILTMLNYFFSQILLFCKLLCDRSISPKAIIYVNTVLPFGGALYGRLTGRKVIYHLHEISITPIVLKLFLTNLVRLTSSLNIYVSEAHLRALHIANVSALCVYNALDINFYSKAISARYECQHSACFNILMISSLRDFKGVSELLTLAFSLINYSKIRFSLVLNEDPFTVDHYFSKRVRPPNLTVYPRASDTTIFYKKASLVLNLSRVDMCIETFGMTILEAMTFGIPVIAPPVGGPTELLSDGIEGFYVDSRNNDLLISRVLQLFNDESLCAKMSHAAKLRASSFSIERFQNDISNAMNQVRL